MTKNSWMLGTAVAAALACFGTPNDAEASKAPEAERREREERIKLLLDCPVKENPTQSLQRKYRGGIHLMAVATEWSNVYPMANGVVVDSRAGALPNGKRFAYLDVMHPFGIMTRTAHADIDPTMFPVGTEVTTKTVIGRVLPSKKQGEGKGYVSVWIFDPNGKALRPIFNMGGVQISFKANLVAFNDDEDAIGEEPNTDTDAKAQPANADEDHFQPAALRCLNEELPSIISSPRANTEVMAEQSIVPTAPAVDKADDSLQLSLPVDENDVADEPPSPEVVAEAKAAPEALWCESYDVGCGRFAVAQMPMTSPLSAEDDGSVALPTRSSQKLGANREGHSHAGNDLERDEGDPTFAVYDGEVGKVDRNRFTSDRGGIRIWVTTWIPMERRTLRTFYAHLQEGSIPNWVQVGAKVKAGDFIGRVGRTRENGQKCNSPHLHFGMCLGNEKGTDCIKVLNPEKFLAQSKPVPHATYLEYAAPLPKLKAKVADKLAKVEGRDLLPRLPIEAIIASERAPLEAVEAKGAVEHAKASLSRLSTQKIMSRATKPETIEIFGVHVALPLKGSEGLN